MPILLFVPPALIERALTPEGPLLGWDCAPDQVQVVGGRGLDGQSAWFTGLWMNSETPSEVSTWTWDGYGTSSPVPTTCSGTVGSHVLQGIAGSAGFFGALPGEGVHSVLAEDERGLWVYAGPQVEAQATLFAFAHYDADRNNELLLQEFLDYLNDWFVRSASSDINADGATDVFDIFAFLTAMR